MSATHDEMCASRKGRACNCGADKQPIAHAPECAHNLNSDYACDCGAETADSIVTMLRAELAEAIAQRDEAQAKAAAALSIAEDARRELATWKKAVGEAAGGKLAWFPSQPVAIPADEGAIRSIVDAIENEHRHVENIAEQNKGATNAQAQLESYERMKMLAGMLERLANTPLFMPRET